MNHPVASSSPAQPVLSVLIGRFQPFHRGHLHLLEAALATPGPCAVVLGSAFQARTPKNPFSWQQRAEMIAACLAPEQRARLHFLPVRDCYDMDRWTALVRATVADLAQRLGGVGSVELVGHFKDGSSDYLHHFPGWVLRALPRADFPDATALRDRLFSRPEATVDGLLAAVSAHLPEGSRAWLANWLATPEFTRLAGEWQMLRDYHAAWAVAPYPPIFVTVDALVTRARHEVLLIRRGHAPGRGLLALPGGFLDPHESLWRATLRELAEETCLVRPEADWRAALQSSAVFDHPDRSQRGRTLTHCHWFDLPDAQAPAVQAADDAAEAAWFPISALPGLEDQFHDDHFHILDRFLGLV